jgi:hypothetical protein
MLIPSKRAALLRKYEGVLFFSEDASAEEKLHGFYLLLRPILGWVQVELAQLGLEKHEVESELYILSCIIFKHFNKDKSSIIPYLEKQLEWRAGRFVAEAKKRYAPTPAEDYRAQQWHDSIDEEFYWRAPSILIEDRYVGKCFTRSEKYTILHIMTSDKLNLSTKALARTMGVDRRTMKEKLNDIRNIFADKKWVE